MPPSIHRLSSRMVAVLLALLLAGCGGTGQPYPPSPGHLTHTSPDGVTWLTAAVLDRIDALPHEPPDQGQSEALRFAAAWEKLARDLMLVIYQSWGDPTFLDLYEAEDSHRDAVGWLLDKYGLYDPNRRLAPGVFADSGLQWLFEDWSLYATEHFDQALYTGAWLAECGIDELEYQLATRVYTHDAVFLYERLLTASRNHLRLFDRWLAHRGLVYEPLCLPDDVYHRIAETPLEFD